MLVLYHFRDVIIVGSYTQYYNVVARGPATGRGWQG